jgi:SAM-dependent methyltransferase
MSFKKIMLRIKKMQFSPSIFWLFINPSYFTRRSLYMNVKYFEKEFSWLLLDVWCGSKPYQELFGLCEQYIWIDYEWSWHNHDGEEWKIFFDWKVFPFGNEYFDCVVSFEVLEHIFEPNDFLKEINRVLKTHWNLLLTTPFIWDEHEIPFDYWRYTSFWLKYILENNWFEIIESKKILNDLSFLSVLLNNYRCKILNKYFPKFIALPICTIIMIFNNIVGLILKIFPWNDNFYFWNIVYCRKKRSL